MFYESQYANQLFGSTMDNAHNEWEVLEFHFHHKSEHTIEGVHYDLEMHIVHVNKDKHSKAGANKPFATAMGFIFDTTKGATVDADTEAAIDGFFDSLKLDSGKKQDLGEIKLANMMKYADLQNRWAYKGSLTTPPCTKTVYFNVLRKVWPLKQKHLDQFKALMKNHANGQFFGSADGNHRVVQPVNTQDPVIIVNTINSNKAGTMQALFIAFLVLFVVALCAFGVACYMYLRVQQSTKVLVPEASVDQELAEAKGKGLQ